LPVAEMLADRHFVHGNFWDRRHFAHADVD
jgi:hypothetical protein